MNRPHAVRSSAILAEQFAPQTKEQIFYFHKGRRPLFCFAAEGGGRLWPAMAAAVGAGTRSRAEDARHERHVYAKKRADAGSLSRKLLVLPGAQFDE